MLEEDQIKDAVMKNVEEGITRQVAFSFHIDDGELLGELRAPHMAAKETLYPSLSLLKSASVEDGYYISTASSLQSYDVTSPGEAAETFVLPSGNFHEIRRHLSSKVLLASENDKDASGGATTVAESTDLPSSWTVFY